MPAVVVPQTLRGAWCDWIAPQPWDLFPTMTSEKQTHPEAMLKRFSYCMNSITRHVYGRTRRPNDPAVQWLVGLERTKRGWPHLHGLVRFPLVDIRGPEGRNVFDLGYWQKWMTDTGGFCWLELPRSVEATANYVTKYVLKDGELVWSQNCEFAAPPGQQLQLVAIGGTGAGSRAQRGPRPSLAGPDSSTL